MDLFQRLMGRASKASSGSRAVDVEQQGSPASSEPLIAAADATASSWRGSGRGADESLPPLIDYDFSTDAAGLRLRELWAAFEEAHAAMGRSLEDILAAFRSFRQAFVAAHQNRCPDMWQVGDDDDPEETVAINDGPAAADEAVLAAPVVPPSTEAAKGHPKVTVVIISTLFHDAWARSGTDEEGDIPLLSSRDCSAQERSWLHQDVHDFLACYHTLAVLSTPTPAHGAPQGQGRQRGRTTRRQRRRREDLVGLLEAMVQLMKRRHDRRLLLHSLGNGLVHFVASLLLALARRTGEVWDSVGAGEGVQQPDEEEETMEALVFLLTCLLLAVQAFSGSVPAYPHMCRLLERRMRRVSGGGHADLWMPPHPWSAARVARMCAGGGEAGWGDCWQSEEAAWEKEDDGRLLLERSVRELAVHKSWSRLAIHEGMLPAILQALRLSLRLSAEIAGLGGLVYRARSSSVAEGDASSLHPLLNAPNGLDIWRLLFVLQAEAFVGIGAALAAHPHEVIAAVDGEGKRLLTESLVAALALDDAGTGDLVRLAWGRTEGAMALVHECWPVVQTTRHVQGLLLASLSAAAAAAAAAQERKARGSSVFPWGGSGKAGSGGGVSRSVEVKQSGGASSLTVHDLGAVLLEGLIRGVGRIEEKEQARQRPPRSTVGTSSFHIRAPVTAQPPVEQACYDLYPWPTTSSSSGGRTADTIAACSGNEDEEAPSSPSLNRQHNRWGRWLSLRESLSSSSAVSRLEDVIDATRPLLHDACATYRLLLDAPPLLEEEEEEEEEGAVVDKSAADAMYASTFAHLLALCRALPVSMVTEVGGAKPQQQEQQQQQQSSTLSLALQIVQGVLLRSPSPPAPARWSPALPRHATAFLARCLLLSPLETIAGCRHLGLWQLLLGRVGLSPPLPPPAETAAVAVALEAEACACDGDGDCCLIHVCTGEGMRPWLRAQDLCLELLHWAFLAAQRPPTTNFLSAPTMEMGLVVGLLEAAITGLEAAHGQEGGGGAERPPPCRDPQQQWLLLLALRCCRWLDLLIREQEEPASTTSAAAAASVSAFNEHGPRLLANLPRLLSSLLRPSPSPPPSPLTWPVRHAALSLFASLLHVASVVESQLTLAPWAADALFSIRTTDASAAAAEKNARRPLLDSVFDEARRSESRPVALFVLTRALHVAAQLTLSAPASSPDAPALGMYREYLDRWLACCVGDDDGGNGEAAVDMAQALCVLLREQKVYSPAVVRFHQWALRRVGAFVVIAEVLEEAETAGLVNQCLALLTALVSGNAMNRNVLAVAFLQEEEQQHEEDGEGEVAPRLLRLHLLRPSMLAGKGGGAMVRALFDLAVGGPFPIVTLTDDKGPGSDSVSGGVTVTNPGVVTLLFQLLPHLPSELQVTVFRMLLVVVARGGSGGGSGNTGQRHEQNSGDALPAELNSGMHIVLLPLLLDAIEALPACSAPQTAAIDLLAEVGSVHMTVPQLRRLLRLLQPHHPDDSPAHRPAHTRRLLRCLSRMVGEERATGPSHYLWMDGGTHSGLRLRPLAGFSKRHYSFITWLRLDAEGGAEGGFSPSSSSSYRPYLFSLVAEDGTALEAYFIPSSSTTDAGGGGRCFSLQLEVRRDKATPQLVEWQDARSLAAGAPRAMSGRWTFLAISHRAPSGFRSAADVTVAIDSASFKGSLPYPSIKALSARSHIGGQHDPASGGVLRGTGLRGRVGAVYLLDEHVKDEQMCALHTRGPDCAAACRLSSSSLLLDPAWEGSLLSHNRVMLLLHPSRLHNSPCPSSCSSSTGDFQMEVEEAGWVSDSFFDSAWEWRGRPLLEMVRDRGQQDGWVGEQQQPALLGRGVVAVARSSVTDALDCVSGAKVLLPVFAQLDLPSSVGECVGKEEEGEDAVLLFDLLGKCLAQSAPGSPTLALFRAGDEEEAEHEGEDDKECAFLLGHLLDRLASAHLSPALLAAIQRLLSRALLLCPPRAAACLILHLLGGDGGAGIRAWRRAASWETQQQALALLLVYLQPTSSRVALPLARRVDPGRLLAGLRLLYPYNNGDDNNKEEQELAAARRTLLEVVATAIAVRATAEAGLTLAAREGDIAAVVDALAACRVEEEGGRGRMARELLRLMLRLLGTLPDFAAYILSTPGSPAYLLVHLAGATTGGACPVAVRLLALRALATACVLAPQQWREKRRRQGPLSLVGKRSGMALLRASLSSVGAAAKFGSGGEGADEEEEKEGFLVVNPEMTCVDANASEEAQKEQLREVLFWATGRLLHAGTEEEEKGQRRAVAAAAARILADVMAASSQAATTSTWPQSGGLPSALAACLLPRWWMEDEHEEAEGGRDGSGDNEGMEAALAALSVMKSDSDAPLAFRVAAPALAFAHAAATGRSNDCESGAIESPHGLRDLEARVGTALEGNTEHQAAWCALLDRYRARGAEALRAAEATAQEERVWAWHHRWQGLLDAVAGERGVWGQGRARLRAFGAAGTGLTGAAPAAVSWVVEEGEDRLRHRRKLVRRVRPGFVLADAVGDEAARFRHAEAAAWMQGAAAAVPAVGQDDAAAGVVKGPVERSSSREELWRDLAKYQRADEEEDEDEEMEEGIDEEAMMGAAAAAAATADSEGEAGRETPVSMAMAAGTAPTAPAPSPWPAKALQASPTKMTTTIATPTRPLSLALGDKRGQRPGTGALAAALLYRAGGKSSMPLAASVSPRLLLPQYQQQETGMVSSAGLTLARLLSSTATSVPLAAGVKDARPCEVIRPFVASPGLFEVHKAALRFTLQEGAAAAVLPEDSTAWCLQPFPSTLWPLDELRAMYLRLYQQQQTALEFFFADRTSLLVNFHARPAALAVYKSIRKLAPRALEPHLGTAPAKIWQRMRTARGSALMQAWQRREISNFEYLSYLNLVAGRTTHDLSQYPVFPWVLADYSSPTLDLNDPANYRDLRWPMGAQRPEARAALQQTYRSLEEDYVRAQAEQDDTGAPPLPPFHHGSHYSTAAFVLWYLLRLEPFASLHVHLQGGRFDHPDRQFRSLAAAYEGCTCNPSDVKELVPEAFSLPDFLANVNGLALGRMQRGEALGDVVLPPWAHGSPEEFVRMHRAALESEIVSARLHHWIDLVFGCCQRPPHLAGKRGGGGGVGMGMGSSGSGGRTAVEACNVFFHLTYHGALDLDALKLNDPLLYESTLKQIQDFGQTPLQLFTKPHPARTPLHHATDLVWPLASTVPGAGTAYVGDSEEERPVATAVVSKPERLLCFPPYALSTGPLLVIAETGAMDRIVTVDGAWRLGVHGWSVQNPDALPPFKLRPDVSFAGDGGLLGCPSWAGKTDRTGQEQQEIALDVDAQLLFTCGYLDNSFKVTVLDLEGQGGDGGGGGGGGSSVGGGVNAPSGGGSRHRLLQSVARHRGVVRCLALGRRRAALHHHGGAHRHALGGMGLSPSALTAAAAAGRQAASVSLGSGGSSGSSSGLDGYVSGRAYLATGGDDCTVRVWVVACRAPLPPAAFEAAASAGGEGMWPLGVLPVHPRPLHVLTGHDAPVLCLAVHAELDVVVSGGSDGCVLVHSLRDGRYIRTLAMEQEEEGAAAAAGIHWVGISPAGYILSYSRDRGLLRSHGLSSGRLLARLQEGGGGDGEGRLHAFCLSEDGQVLLSGGADCRVTLRWCHSLKLADDGPRAGMGVMAVVDGGCESMVPRIPPLPSTIRSLVLTAGERHLLVGLETGEMRVLAPDAAYLRSRLKKRLEALGFF